MTDYYPLIRKAVAALENDTDERRHALYARIRCALIRQLRDQNSPRAGSELTRERLALEEAIRRVEAEVARGCTSDLPRRDSLSALHSGGPIPEQKPPDRPAQRVQL